jgi:hypothetical protein
LLDRTSLMVSENLREGGIEDKNPGNPVSKDSGIFPEVRSRKGDLFPQTPNFGLCQGSSRVPTGGVFGDRASRGLFADYEATQGPPPRHGQASAATPTGGLFGATSSGGVVGNTPTGTGLFGNDCGASGRPNTNSCASNLQGAQGRQHPGLNTTVTVNLNGLTVSGVRGDGQGLFASFQNGSDSTPNNSSHFNISHFNRRDEPDDGLSGNLAQRSVRPQNDGPINAAIGLDQTRPQPSGIFSGLSHEANSHANIAARGGMFESPAQHTTPHVFGSSHAFQAAMADPTRYLDVNVPSGTFGTTPRGTPTHVPARTSTTPLGNPGSTLESHTSGRLFGGESRSASTPATGAFGNSTPPSLFGEPRVPHGSYRYEPTTGTLKASDRTGPEAAAAYSTSTETVDARTPEPKLSDAETNKKARFFATVEDESPVSSTKDTGKSNSNFGKATHSSPFSNTTTDTSKPTGSAFSGFVPKKTDTQLPPPPVSMFAQSAPAGGASNSSGPPPPVVSAFAQGVIAGAFPPVTVQEHDLAAAFRAAAASASTELPPPAISTFVQGASAGAFPPVTVEEPGLAAAFRTAAAAPTTVPLAATVPITSQAGPLPPSVSAFASAPVSMFATATVPAQVAEPVRVERLPQQIPVPAQQIPVPAQKVPVKKAQSGGGLFDSVYAS